MTFNRYRGKYVLMEEVYHEPTTALATATAP